MTHFVRAQRKIDAPASDVWDVIAKATGMEDWYPGLIASSSVDPSCEQTTRSCVMADGGKLEERILIVDDKTRTFIYAIDSHPLPAANVVGTIRIDEHAGGCTATWSAQLRPALGQEEAIVKMVTGMYEAGLESLSRYVE